MSKSATVKTGSNGRDARGKFAPGNKAARGNPFAKRCAELRSKLFDKLTPRRLDKIIEALLDAAAGGDLAAIKLTLQYGVGEPIPHDLVAEIEEMRTKLAEIEQWQTV